MKNQNGERTWHSPAMYGTVGGPGGAPAAQQPAQVEPVEPVPFEALDEDGDSSDSGGDWDFDLRVFIQSRKYTPMPI
jgi:hypothetical protein